MGDRSAIEWTDATWNPYAGCSRVSPGCRYCYAERQSPRLQANNVDGYAGVVRSTDDGPRWTGRVNTSPNRLGKPLRWTRPRRIFVSSMSDPFHESLEDSSHLALFTTMVEAIERYGHVFQVLTKRASRLLDWMTTGWAAAAEADGLWRAMPAPEWPGWDKLWVGVSVEDEPRTDRLRLLAQVPNAVRFVSFEPLLAALDLSPFSERAVCERCLGAGGTGAGPCARCDGTGEMLSLPWEWGIIGGESGAGKRTRPMRPSWARRLIADHEIGGVPVLFKQWGDWSPNREDWPEELRETRASDLLDADRLRCLGNDGLSLRIGKKAAGRTIDNRLVNNYPTGRRR